MRRLACANLVLYDALVSKDVLKLAPQARRLFVGKRRSHHCSSPVVGAPRYRPPSPSQRRRTRPRVGSHTGSPERAARLLLQRRQPHLDKASYFRAYGFTRARSLTGGLAAWDAEVGREAIPARVEELRE